MCWHVSEPCALIYWNSGLLHCLITAAWSRRVVTHLDGVAAQLHSEGRRSCAAQSLALRCPLLRCLSQVLEKLAERHPGSSYHFVEDKLGTLEKVSTTCRTSKHFIARCALFRCRHSSLCIRPKVSAALILPPEHPCASVGGTALVRVRSSGARNHCGRGAANLCETGRVRCRCARCRSWTAGSCTWWIGATTHQQSGDGRPPIPEFSC